MSQHSTYIVFDGDDEAYFDWLDQNPQGFVLNVAKASSDPIVLHQATCRTIGRNSGRKDGSSTANTQYKVVALTIIELKAWQDPSRSNNEIHPCGTCHPL
ncbi:hypothetical protein ACP8Y2_08415 [Herpetosiphon llansteffanensis]